MNMRQLASEIAKREGKKTQARIGEIRELLSIVSDILYDELSEKDFSTFVQLFNNGKRRTKTKKTKE